MKFDGLVAGSLTGGAMFYAYRLLGQNGAVTDWSMAMGPIMIPNRRTGGTRSWEDYCSIRYAKSDEKSACGVSLTITGVDTAFHKIQLAALVSNENTTFERGYICLEEVITGTSMTLLHLSDASYGLVLAEDVQISTQSLLGCADFDIVNNIMVVIGPKVDEALATIEEGDQIKFNKVEGATIVGKVQQIQFDNNSSVATNPLSTNPPIGHQNTAQTITYSKYKNQTTGVDVTDTIAIPTGFVGYKEPIVATLMRNGWRGETLRLAMIPVSKYGKRLGARYLGDFTLPFRGGQATTAYTNITSADTVRLIEESANVYLANIISLVVGNIDISQWVHEITPTTFDCDIQGFHIVVSPRDPKTLHEGALFAAANYTHSDWSLMEEYGLIYGNTYNNSPTINDTRPIKNLYSYYSPDVQNDLLVVSEQGSLLQIEEQYKGQFTQLLPNAFPVWPSGYSPFSLEPNGPGPLPGANDGFSPFHYSTEGGYSNTGLRIWNKYFKYLQSGDSNGWLLARNPAYRQNNNILGYYDLTSFNAAVDHASQKIYIEEMGHKVFINAYWGMCHMVGWDIRDGFGSGAACRLIVTETSEGQTDYGKNPYATCFTNGVTVVSSKNNGGGTYGGTSDSALTKTIYRSCWHYQPINDAILLAIKKGDGTFVFDNIEVFAGDSYIVPYSLDRLSHGINYGTDGTQDPEYKMEYHTNAFVVPLQSNINWTMSGGDKWEKHRGLRVYYSSTNANNNITGIGVINKADFNAYGRLESSEYPTLARVVYGQNLYYALPESVFYTDEYPMRVFWSKRKIDAEEMDNFRVFPFENYQSIPGDFGLPVAIRSSMENAVIFTMDCIGVMPVDERSAVSDESGKQLSIGRSSGVGKFTVIDRRHGLQHFFSLSQRGEDFTWFDFKNRDWIYWGKGQGLTDLSSKYKFTSDFLSVFSDPLLFSETSTKVRTMFGNDGEIILYKPSVRAFVFDILNNIYQGRRNIVIGENVLLNSLPIVSNSGILSISGYGTHSKTGGAYMAVELTMVANDHPLSKKVFDSFVCACKNVKQIVCTNQKGEVSTITILDSSKFLYKYAIVQQDGDQYFGEMPLTTLYDYLRGFYVTVKLVGFEDDSEAVAFNSLILNVRNDI